MKHRFRFLTKRIFIIFLFSIGSVSSSSLCFALTGVSGSVSIEDDDGDLVSLYNGSYALLIGISEYDKWDDLKSIPNELEDLGSALSTNGFDVTTKFNLGSKELGDSIKSFINKYGYREDNRLIIYFSGHGHTWAEKSRGFLVPKDAPLPTSDDGHPGVSFLRKALAISQMVEWSTQMTAKHGLFVFDSCFSGTIFQVSRDKPKKAKPAPRFILGSAARPVRQYISAGKAGEKVPSKSVFTPFFANAIRFGEGDLNRDGYVTGAELGLHLQTSVPEFSRDQTPQYGKHSTYDLAQGDYVFVLSNKGSSFGVDGPLESIDNSNRQNQADKADRASTGTPAIVLDKPIKLDARALFSTGSADLSGSGTSAIDQLAQGISELNEVSRVVVVGHTDSRGAEGYNQTLSEQRAQSVRSRLATSLPYLDIAAIGRGETRPVAANDTALGRAKNRRVEIVVIGTKQEMQ